MIVYDYTPTRARAGPAKFLEGYKGYLQADAYSVYDAFFKPQRGMTEVGCWMHAPEVSVQGSGIRRAAHGTGATPDRTPVYRRGARQGAVAVGGATVGIAPTSIIAAARETPPVSAGAAAGGSAKKSIRRCEVRYALNQWEALTRFLEDGELEIDNGHGTGQPRYRVVFVTGSSSAVTAAARRRRYCEASSLPASGISVEPFAWFRDVLVRIPMHSIARLSELLPHNWKPMTCSAQA